MVGSGEQRGAELRVRERERIVGHPMKWGMPLQLHSVTRKAK